MSKRALILLSEFEAARGLAATLGTLGVKSTCHRTVFEAVSELYSSQLGWILLALDLFDPSSRAQLMTPDLWSLNRQTPVVLVSREDPAALRKFFAGGPMQLSGIIAPQDPERLADRAFTLYLETVGQEVTEKAESGSGPAAAKARPAASGSVETKAGFRPAASGNVETKAGFRPAEAKPAPRPAAAPVEPILVPELDLEDPLEAEAVVRPGAGSSRTLGIEEKRRIEAKLQLLDDGDYYRILEVPVAATDRQVKAAYFRLVKQFHPDRYFGRLDDEWNKHVTRLFRGITRTYETILDPKARQRYDASYKPAAPTPVYETIVEAGPVEEEAPPPQPMPEEDEVPLTREELDEFLRREKEWIRDKDSQASAKAQALFDLAADVLGHPDAASLPLAPIREAYKVVSEAALLVPDNEEYAEAQDRLRALYESKRAYYHFRRGQERLAASEMQAGYQDLKDAVMFDPKTEYLLLLVQTMLQNSWDLTRAEILSQSLVDEEPENPLFRLLYGRALAAQGHLKDGLAHLHLAARLGLKNEAFQWIHHFEKQRGH